MNNVTEWPVCTAHYRDCGHAQRHETPGEADDAARAHKEYVNRNGYAICTCHPPVEAERLRVTPFPCGEAL